MEKRAIRTLEKYFNRMNLAGNELGKVLDGHPIGVGFMATGHFLLDTWEGCIYGKKEKREVERLRKKLNKVFEEQGHSGTSAVVATAVFLGSYKQEKSSCLKEGDK